MRQSRHDITVSRRIDELAQGSTAELRRGEARHAFERRNDVRDGAAPGVTVRAGEHHDWSGGSVTARVINRRARGPPGIGMAPLSSQSGPVALRGGERADEIPRTLDVSNALGSSGRAK